MIIKLRRLWTKRETPILQNLRAARMERVERFYLIDQLLRSQTGGVSRKALLDRLGISLPTFKRDLEYMRNRFWAPIVWDSSTGKYRFDFTQAGADRYNLPGLWFSPREAHALLVLEAMLQQIQPGALTDHTSPFRSRLEKLLEDSIDDREQLRRRIRILSMGGRAVDFADFSLLAHAVLKRKQVHLKYEVRARGELTERTVSPQRLVHYRDNWYLDAWCHLRRGLRSFAVDAIQEPALLDKKAKSVPDKTLDRELASSYGIYSGQPDSLAVLRFSVLRSRWVAKETWHPDQRAEIAADGRLILRLPYLHDEELIMDILKYGPDVEVLDPPALRQAIHEKVLQTRALYDT
jgi:predicted DNA-binding transcriptional regulator YafY